MGIFSVFSFLAVPLGYVMQFLYSFVQNYGVALILFTVIIRLLMFPLTLIQQKSTAKNAAYQPMIQEIQKKWANDKQRQQQEMMKFQEENGIKMSAGCLPMLANFVVLFSVIEVIYRPLRYILGVNADLITKATEYLQNVPDLGTVSDYTAQSHIIGLVNSGDAGMIELLGTDVANKIATFNFNFLGLNMSQVPTFSMETIPYLVLPILSILTMFLSQIIIMKTSGQSQAGAGKTMLIMTVVMGVWFGFYAFTVPVGFSLYYAVSNILSLVQQLIVKRIYDPEKLKQQVLDDFEERKKAKKAKKVVKVKDESGSVIAKEMSDDEIARLRLAKARELDEKRYLESEEEKKQVEETAKKAAQADEEKYEKNTAKNTGKSAEKPEKDGSGEGETVVAAPADAAKEQSAQAKAEYKPGRRKRAKQSKTEETNEGPSFADKERAAEEDNKD